MSHANLKAAIADENAEVLGMKTWLEGFSLGFDDDENAGDCHNSKHGSKRSSHSHVILKTVLRHPKNNLGTPTALRSLYSSLLWPPGDVGLCTGVVSLSLGAGGEESE